MKCPKCGSEDNYYCRDLEKADVLRYLCKECKHRWNQVMGVKHD